MAMLVKTIEGEINILSLGLESLRPQSWRDFVPKVAVGHPQTLEKNRRKNEAWRIFRGASVDGSEIWRENQLRLVVYPIIYILYIPGGWERDF